MQGTVAWPRTDLHPLSRFPSSLKQQAVSGELESESRRWRRPPARGPEGGKRKRHGVGRARTGFVGPSPVRPVGVEGVLSYGRLFRGGLAALAKDGIGVGGRPRILRRNVEEGREWAGFGLQLGLQWHGMGLPRVGEVVQCKKARGIGRRRRRDRRRHVCTGRGGGLLGPQRWQLLFDETSANRHGVSVHLSDRLRTFGRGLLNAGP
jgi:hypothetical protein